MKKNSFFLMISILSFGFQGGAFSAVVVDEIKPKELKHPMINELLEYFTPGVAARVILSAENTKTVLNSLNKFEALPRAKKEKLEDRVVRKLRSIIVIPVQEFFELLHQYRILLKPIVRESFAGTGIEFKTSLLYKFLRSSKKEIKSFFISNVKTKDDLHSACEEFKVLFGDLEITFPDIFLGAREWLKDQKQAENDKENDKEKDKEADKEKETGSEKTGA